MQRTHTGLLSVTLVSLGFPFLTVDSETFPTPSRSGTCPHDTPCVNKWDLITAELSANGGNQMLGERRLNDGGTEATYT